MDITEELENDIKAMQASLRRIAGANPVVEAGKRGPGNLAVVETFKAMKEEANKALDAQFEREYERAGRQAQEMFDAQGVVSA